MHCILYVLELFEKSRQSCFEALAMEAMTMALAMAKAMEMKLAMARAMASNSNGNLNTTQGGLYVLEFLRKVGKWMR
jgi:hypothetical protein